ncbi:hypothetical protein ACWDTG_06610 [Rhodococcus zopfii]
MQWIAALVIILIVGLVLAYWKAVIAAIAALILVGVVIGAWKAVQRRAKARRDEVAAIAARADREHQQFLEGNEDGVYGRHRPVDLDRPRPTPLPATMKEWREQRRK